MPDDFDYEWLGWLVEHPDEWTPSDLSTAQDLVAWQKESMAALHPRDHEGRWSSRAVVNQLEDAIRRHLRRRSP